MTDTENKAWIYYFIKENLSGTLITHCEQQEKLNGKDINITFWKSFGYIMEGIIIIYFLMIII